ncbi:hypothetical protein [Ornithinimicrobium kibberense]|uniref:hypothetical protein n=1 Tax=Ornithinimicrobium kibberense TaxID=282060 RepID=UPI003613FE14
MGVPEDRRWVAARVTARTGPAPAAVSARAHSTSVAPVVTTSSTSTHGSPTSRSAAPGRTRTAPARLLRRRSASSPAWSSTRRASRSASTVGSRARRPKVVSRHSAATRCSPLARVPARADGAGTRGRRPVPRSVPRWSGDAASAAARTPRSGTARTAVRSARPPSFQATTAVRTSSRYAVCVQVGGNPGGQGVGVHRRADPAASACRQVPHHRVPSRPQPPQAVGAASSRRWSRSSPGRHGIPPASPGDGRTRGRRPHPGPGCPRVRCRGR